MKKLNYILVLICIINYLDWCAIIPYFDYSGKKIFYQCNENHSQNAILFIHGAGGNSNIWKDQLKLDINYNLYALDLPSHNKSDNISELSLDIYINAIKNLINYIGAEEIILCGHSLGGAIIQEFYFKYPNDVSALILCGTGGRLRVDPHILTQIKSNYQEYLNDLQTGAFYTKTPKEIKLKSIEETTKTTPEVTYIDFEICDNFDTLDKTSSIEVPCLIVCGKHDKLTPLKYSKFFYDNINNSNLVIIKKAGHMVMIEQPKKLNKAIENFIKNNSRKNN